MITEKTPYKAGFVALVGWPNAGKSTLANHLVGEKVSIVTAKPQTTRRRISSILTTENYQAIFVDSPGYVRDEKGLNKFLKKEFEKVIEDSDVILLVLNVDEENPKKLFGLIEKALEFKKPIAAVVTKTDLNLKRSGILKAHLAEAGIPSCSVNIQEDREYVRSEIEKVIVSLLPESAAPLYDESYFTMETLRDLAAERIREKCFEELREEIPYGLAVQVRKFEEGKKLVKISADVILEKENHKMMVIGRGGQMLKSIGMSARQDIEKMIDSKVFLDLHVAVKKKWMKNNQIMESLGYVVTK